MIKEIPDLFGNYASTDGKIYTKWIEVFDENERKTYEAMEYRKSASSLISGGGNSRPHRYDPKNHKLWNTFYADKYSNLGEKLYGLLVNNAEVSIDLNELLPTLCDKEGYPLDYCTFQLDIKIDDLKKYLSEYCDEFMEDKFNPGDKFGYIKQREDVSVQIQRLLNSGFSPNALLIDSTDL